MTIRPDLLKYKAVEAYEEGFAVGKRWYFDDYAPDGSPWAEYIKIIRENRNEWMDGFFDGLFGKMEATEKEIEKEMR
jgi:hypothetical protein